MKKPNSGTRSGRDQQDMWERDDYLAKKENQFNMLKTFFRNDWAQWSEEKRKDEIRDWMIIAWYIANENQKS